MRSMDTRKKSRIKAEDQDDPESRLSSETAWALARFGPFSRDKMDELWKAWMVDEAVGRRRRSDPRTMLLMQSQKLDQSSDYFKRLDTRLRELHGSESSENTKILIYCTLERVSRHFTKRGQCTLPPIPGEGESGRGVESDDAGPLDVVDLLEEHKVCNVESRKWPLPTVQADVKVEATEKNESAGGLERERGRECSATLQVSDCYRTTRTMIEMVTKTSPAETPKVAPAEKPAAAKKAPAEKEWAGASICERSRQIKKRRCQGGSGNCEHNRQRSRCKECRGSEICEHNRNRSYCKECGGSQICEHKRRRQECKECGGSQICEHQRRRIECKECGGSLICEHKRRRDDCKQCGGSRICERNRHRFACKECRGSSICEHKRRRQICKECGGASICEHNRRRQTCTDCGGGSICKNKRRRNNCKECGGSQICEHNRKRQRCKECGGSSICEHNRRKENGKQCSAKGHRSVGTTDTEGNASCAG